MDFFDSTLIEALTTPPLFPALMACLGLVFGGFLTVAADRLGQIAKREDAGKDITEDFGLCYPPSSCDKCARRLMPWEIIPVIGWLVTRGRCKKCGYRIPVLLPLFEALCALAFLWLALSKEAGLPLLLDAVLIWFLLCLALSDLLHRTLPDRLTLPLLWIGLLAAATGWRGEGSIDAASAILGATLGYGAFWLIREIYFWIRGAIGLGGGDLKLMAALGAWGGAFMLPQVAMTAAILTLIFVLCLLIITRKKVSGHLPFGPALALAGGWLIFAPDGLTQLILGSGSLFTFG